MALDGLFDATFAPALNVVAHETLGPLRPAGLRWLGIALAALAVVLFGVCSLLYSSLLPPPER
jgi:hypothetical protein